MQVELGTAQRGETLRLPAPANRILIRPGFIFELYSTGKVTNKLTDAVKCEQALLLTVRVDRERPMDIAHLAVCRLQRANNRFFVYEEFRVKIGNEWANEIRGTKVVHGPLRRIELGSIDSKRFVHKRIRWCTNSDRSAKALTAWNLTKALSHLRECKKPCGNQVVLGSREGRFVDGWNYHRVGLETCRDRYQRNTFSHLTKMQDNCDEIEQHYDDVSGTFLPPELIRAGRAEEIRCCERSCCTTLCPDKQQLREESNQPLCVGSMSTKRDENKYNVRCVGKKLQAKTMMEASLAHELLSAMPPRERAKFLLIFLVTDGVSDPEKSWKSEYSTSLLPTSCQKLTEICTSSFRTKPRHQEKAMFFGRLNCSMYGFREASNSWMLDWQSLPPVRRVCGWQGQSCVVLQQTATRDVQFMATTSTCLQTGLQSITSEKCWHPSTRFVKAIDSDSENIAQGQQWLRTESLYWERVKDADSFRLS